MAPRNSKLCVILRLRLLRVLYGLIMQEVQSVYEEDKSKSAEFKEWVCLCLGKYIIYIYIYTWYIPGIF